MTARQTPQRLQLGGELRMWRDRSGLDAQAVATELVCSVSKISRIESGQAAVSPLELQLLLRLYEVPEGEPTERIEAIAEAARQRSARYRVPQWARAYISQEAGAAEIRDFQIDLIPGLLQTEAYTRAIATVVDPTRPAVEVDRLAVIRRQRQARLTGDNPPLLFAVVHESALRTRVGGASVMRDQLARLRQFADLPNVRVQVLPFEAGEHAGMGSAFTILRLPDDEAQVVYLEGLWDADYVNRPEQVAAYSGVFDRLAELALDENDTATMINTVAGELR